MPSNLARIEIMPMDDATQRQWFHRWGNLIGQDDAYLRQILQDSCLPERFKELAREPLLLYLLAAMHRDGELRLAMFSEAKGAQAKVLIYERTLDWVLTKQRAEGYRREPKTQDTVTARDLNPDITELAPDHLRRILQEAGLCVVQSGMEFASIRAIEDRLTQDSAAKAFLEDAQKRLDTDDTPLRNALAAFYLQEGRQGEGSIEFVHKSFGEFLCAERILNGLIDVCQPGRNREYDIDDPAFCWLMYDLLGCHVLTPEIVEYLTALLTKHADFQPEKLHKRLYDFYWRWSDGEFIDAPPENLPQLKMRLLRERSPDRQERLGQRQVDIHAGLNTMILLWELHRQNQDGNPIICLNSSAFHPCRHSNSESFDEQRLLRIFELGHCLNIKAFSGRYAPFLSQIELAGVKLRRANFFAANLCAANLAGAILEFAFLSGANLSGANLSGANLSGANLSSANLSGANLDGANLNGANLDGANISSAYFRHANLNGANLSSADLSNADFLGTNLRSTNLRDADLFSADLISADLRSANLCNANLRNADLTGAILSDQHSTIQWDGETNWRGVTGLRSAVGMPKALKFQLGLG